MSERFNLINIIIGRRGSGKTYFTKKRLFPIYKKKGMKILIIDTFAHPAYTEVPRIFPNQIPRWKNGVYRMYGHHFDNEVLPAIAQLTNCFIVFEDAKKYVRQKVQEELTKLCIDSKQKNLDLLFLYHTWGFVPPDLIRVADFIEVFPTADSPEVRKQQIIGVFQEALEVHKAVHSAKTPWPHKTIDLRN